MKFDYQTNELLFTCFKEHFDRFHIELSKVDVASKRLKVEEMALNDNGVSFKEINEIIENQIQPSLSASNGGRYWGFVTGGANPVATFTDWLVTTYNQNVSKGGDSIASSIERQTLAWLCQLFYLPQSFKGIVTTGATSANLLGALTARQYAGSQQGIDVAKQGMSQLSVDIFAATPHASMVKSLGLAGFGQNNYIQVPCLNNSEAIDTLELEQLLGQSKAKSRIVIASAATVTGTDYDNLIEVSRLCNKYSAWLHVDAAFGIFERLIAGPQGKTKGLEFADSITLDCHKWLNVPYDCGVFLTLHQQLLKETCHVAAPYLLEDKENIDFMSLGIENSRRFRAFPVWATLKYYGRSGIKQQIEKNIKQAKAFANWLAQSEHYELVKPCQLNVVLFRPSKSLNLSSNQCMTMLNNTGRVFLTPGQWQGEPIMRAALSNWSTEMNDVEHVISLLDDIAQSTLSA